ncbi:hypothetical protein KXX11_003882, partial [Aspergillus fumigatus]
GPAFASVRAGPEARPGGARRAAAQAARQGAAAPASRPPTRGPARTPHADARGLRAAGPLAQHQQRHRPGARCRWHQPAAGAAGRLLWRGEIPPQRPGRRPDPDARQRRRLVAAAQLRPGRMPGDECLGLQRHGQGIRPPAQGRPGLCRPGAPGQRAHPRPQRAAARAGAAAQAAPAG